ncbi:MAG: hypothetical protein ABI782_00210 [Anaerolineaceae bacterium]
MPSRDPYRPERLLSSARELRSFNVAVARVAISATIGVAAISAVVESRLRFSWNSDMGGGLDSVVAATLGGAERLMTIEHSRLPARRVTAARPAEAQRHQERRGTPEHVGDAQKPCNESADR